MGGAFVALTSILSNTAPSPLIRAIAAYRKLHLRPRTAKPTVQLPPKRRALQLTASQLERLAASYNHGASVYALAEMFQINRRTVARHLKRMDVAMSSGRLFEPTISQVQELYRAGKTPSTIATITGTRELLVWRALRAAGMTE